MTKIFFRSSRFFDADASAHARKAGADLTVPFPLEDVLASGAATQTICWLRALLLRPPLRRCRSESALRTCDAWAPGPQARLLLWSIAWLLIKSRCVEIRCTVEVKPITGEQYHN